MIRSIARHIFKTREAKASKAGRRRRRQNHALRGGDDSTISLPTVDVLRRYLLWLERLPRRRTKALVWKAMTAHGVYGVLAEVLNDGGLPTFRQLPRPLSVLPPAIRTLLLATAGRMPAEVTGWPTGYGRELVGAFRRGGWKGVQISLLLHPPVRQGVVANAFKLAMIESLLFEHAGFHMALCSHEHHWFVSNDRRRTDCPLHRLAAQQARTRLNARRRAVLKCLGFHGMTLEELRRVLRIGGRGLHPRTLQAVLMDLFGTKQVVTRADGQSVTRFYRMR